MVYPLVISRDVSLDTGPQKTLQTVKSNHRLNRLLVPTGTSSRIALRTGRLTTTW